MADKKLFLLDAMALIYRAHFAFSKSPRINSKGMNTGAVLGFTNSLLDVLNKEAPTHMAVVFDTHAPTFRHEFFVDYKSTRQEQPEDIGFAIPVIKDLVDAFRIPCLELDGYEADDIIGTIAKKAALKGFEVYMMTPDKDYSQLVEDSIFLYKPAYMGNAVDVLGVKEVLKKFEIENVDQVRDILGLMGDVVDNVPGIPGVGAKTAVKFIQEFGSIENLVKNTHKLKGKLKDKVEEFASQAILSKKLVTIHVDVPIDFELDKMKFREPDREKLKIIFEELEFRTMARRIFGESRMTGTDDSGQLSMFQQAETDVSIGEIKSDKYKTLDDLPCEYTLIEHEDDLKKLNKQLLSHQEICFDTETTGVNAVEADLVGLSFAVKKGEAFYIPVPQDPQLIKSILDQIREPLEDPSIRKIGQNLKYDILVLKKYGIEVNGGLFDTMIAHYLFEPEGRHSMDVMAENFLGYSPVSIETLIGKKGKNQLSMRDVEIEKVYTYACEDADITLQLKEAFEPILREKGLVKLFEEVECPLIYVLADMEYSGVQVDPQTLSVLSEEMAREAKKLEKEICDLAGCEFNISSPKQLGEILFDVLKLIDNPKKTKTGQYATGEEILSRLAGEHVIVQRILDYREVQKLKSTYVDALPTMISRRDGRVHTSFNQTIAATGRLSSTNPNLQNIPIRTEKGREIRKAFVASDPDHIILSVDYSQIELRIMAAFSKDESMIQAFREGKDIHTITASKIFQVPLDEVTGDKRRIAKMANFGIIYGISAFGLSQRLNIPRREAAEIIDAYFKEFPSVKKYMDDVINKARENEYVETILGRRRYLRDINSRNATMRGFAERNAINAPIQGSAADLIKVAMINIFDYMKKEKLRSKMILQVHDELVFDVYEPELKELEPEIIKLMKTAISLNVPVEVESGTGSHWLDAH
ncbi:MAG: DNA polymerase I [Cyclobacteriaceae bacterium]|nr:DNA polymerase I [Cyclobacteriaceae bacterium]